MQGHVGRSDILAASDCLILMVLITDHKGSDPTIVPFPSIVAVTHILVGYTRQ